MTISETMARDANAAYRRERNAEILRGLFSRLRKPAAELTTEETDRLRTALAKQATDAAAEYDGLRQSRERLLAETGRRDARQPWSSETSAKAMANQRADTLAAFDEWISRRKVAA